MVFKALSERVKKLKSGHKKEQQLRNAVAAYKAGQEGLGPKKSFRDVASEFNVPRSSLERRVKGGQSILEFNQGKQKLTPTEERTLANFIHESAEHGFPLSHCQIEMFANAILQSRLGLIARNLASSGSLAFLIVITRNSRPIGVSRSTHNAQILSIPRLCSHGSGSLKNTSLPLESCLKICMGWMRVGFQLGIRGRNASLVAEAQRLSINRVGLTEKMSPHSSPFVLMVLLYVP